jgi:hypothetical protein
MNSKVWSIIGETINTMNKIEENILQKSKKNVKNNVKNNSISTKNRNNTRKNTKNSFVKNSFVKNNSVLHKRGRNNTVKNPRKNPRSISI